MTIKDPASTISIVADAPMTEATAMPVTTNYAVSDPSSIKPPATTPTIPAPAAPTTQTSNPPPGVKDGGRWGITNVIIGPVTWTYCIVYALRFGVFSGCGLCVSALLPV
jgi:hypothetical protein